VHPDWTATTHLSIQTSAGALAGSAVSLACQVLRAGRTSVFAGADLTAPDGTAIGSATIGFARLTRRDGNPTGAPEGGVHRLGDGEADGPRPPLIEFLGLRDAPGGGVELVLTPWIANSTGTIQGGVVASILAQAAQASAGPGRVADLEVHYLAAGRTGPFRATGDVVRRSDGSSVVRVRLVDTGDSDKLLATGVASVLTAGEDR
jgi:acyl-coenzyme A thioesterase PaaI-like protein